MYVLPFTFNIISIFVSEIANINLFAKPAIFLLKEIPFTLPVQIIPESIRYMSKNNYILQSVSVLIPDRRSSNLAVTVIVIAHKIFRKLVYDLSLFVQ